MNENIDIYMIKDVYWTRPSQFVLRIQIGREEI